MVSLAWASCRCNSRLMKLATLPILLATASLAIAAPAQRTKKPHTAHPPKAEAASKAKPDANPPLKEYFKPGDVRSTGTVTVGGQPVAYDAVAGTLVVHAKDWEDTDTLDSDTDKSADKDKNAPKPEASMFYTAYFKQGAPAAGRPNTFLFNGGPGSSSNWLHKGAFGPVRVPTVDNKHSPPAP
jgi:carboxypeptidase C (cathepsin A)